MKDIDLVNALCERVARYDNRHDAAEAMGISYEYLSNMMAQQVAVSKRVAKMLGFVLRRKITYEIIPAGRGGAKR